MLVAHCRRKLLLISRLRSSATLPLLALAMLAVVLIPIDHAPTAQAEGQMLAPAVTSKGDDAASEPGREVTAALGLAASTDVVAADGELDPRIPPMIDLCAVADPARSILRVGPGEAYTTLQAAADQAAPGDSICMRGGVYTNTENAPFASLDRDGTKEAPIFVGPLPGEVVILQGTGTEAAWDDATFQEWEDGDRNMAFIINGDHWIVSGFEIRYLNRGIRINGDYNTVIGVHGHNFWEGGFDMGRDPDDATVGPDLDVVGNRYVLVHTEFCRHCSGFSFGPQGNEATLLQDNTFEFISGGFHGYEPDGDKVRPVPGDSAGGGNSDMLAGGKECSDGVQDGDFTMANGETDNICRNTTIRYSIGWHNADDSFDISPNGVTFMANIGFDPGPEGNKGLKNLRHSFGRQDYFANLMVGGDAGDSRGFEARYADPLTRWINNAAYANDNQGFIFSFADGVEPGAGVVFENNVSAANGQAFSNVLASADVGISNSDADGPMLSGGDPAGFSLDTQRARTMPPRERWNHYYQQFENYFRPTVGSPLVDAGVFVAGVHCDRADDAPTDPYPESDPDCIHWRGMAPDQGPFESAGCVPSADAARPSVDEPFVNCDILPSPPNASVDVSCLADNGRIDVYITNDGPTADTYAVTIGALAPRERTVAVNETRRVTATGRRDGPLVVGVSRTSDRAAPDFMTTVNVACDPPVGATPQIAVSCLAGNGRVDIRVGNLLASASTFSVDFGALARRTRQVAPGGSTRFTVTGRPDGPHDIVVRRGSTILTDTAVVVTCDG